MVRLLPTRSLHLSAANIHCSGAKELSGPTKGATEAAEGLKANHVQVVVLVISGRCWPVLLMRSGILQKGLPAQWQSNTAVEAQIQR